MSFIGTQIKKEAKSGNAGKKVYSDSGKVKTYKSSGKNSVGQYNKTGQVKTSSNAKQTKKRIATVQAQQKKAARQSSPLSAVSKLFDILSAPSASVSQARYNYNTGKSVLGGAWSGFKNSIMGKEYKTNADVIKYKQANKGNRATWFDYWTASQDEDLEVNVKTGQVVDRTTKQPINQEAYNTNVQATGMIEDMLFDPLNVFGGGALKAGKQVLKGSGASLTAFNKAAKTMKATGSMAENATHASQMKNAKATAKVLWDDKATKTSILTGTNKEAVATRLKSRPAFSSIPDEKIDEIAEDTVRSFRKNALKLNTDAEDIEVKIKGLGNTSFDKARGVLLRGKLKTVESLQKAGDMTVAPYWNELTERLRATRFAKAFSNSNKYEDLVKSNILGGKGVASSANQLDATDFVVKQAMESKRMKAAMITDVQERADTIQTLVKDMSDEQQLALLKSLERGDFRNAERLYEKFGTGENALENVKQMKSTLRELEEKVKAIFEDASVVKFSPNQYLYYSIYGKMPSMVSKDAELLACIDLKRYDLDTIDVDFGQTFLKGIDSVDSFRQTGRIDTKMQGVESLYSDNNFRNAVQVAYIQLEQGREPIPRIMENFVNKVGADDAYRFLEANAVHKNDALTRGIEKVEGGTISRGDISEEGEFLEDMIKDGGSWRYHATPEDLGLTEETFSVNQWGRRLDELMNDEGLMEGIWEKIVEKKRRAQEILRTEHPIEHPKYDEYWWNTPWREVDQELERVKERIKNSGGRIKAEERWKFLPDEYKKKMLEPEHTFTEKTRYKREVSETGQTAEQMINDDETMELTLSYYMERLNKVHEAAEKKGYKVEWLLDDDGELLHKLNDVDFDYHSLSKEDKEKIVREIWEFNDETVEAKDFARLENEVPMDKREAIVRNAMEFKPSNEELIQLKPVSNAYDGQAINALKRRAMKNEDALEEAYQALKKSSMEARIMQTNPVLYKDAEDLIAFVEAKVIQSGVSSKEALMTLSPEMREALISSYSSTAEGFENLYGKVDGISTFERAQAFAEQRGEGALQNANLFINDEEKTFLKSVAELADMLDGRDMGSKLGDTFEQNLAHIDRYQRELDNAERALTTFGDVNTIEREIAKMFEDEMNRIVGNELSSGTMYHAYSNDNMTRAYVPHVETKEYRDATKGEKHFKKGEFSSVYSKISNPYDRSEIGLNIDDVYTNPETGEQIQKYKQNITEIFLDRALRSNAAIYGKEASDFLYHNCTKQRGFSNPEEISEAFANVDKGNRIGVTYSSVNSLLNKMINDKIEDMARDYMMRVMSEVVVKEADEGVTLEQIIRDKKRFNEEGAWDALEKGNKLEGELERATHYMSRRAPIYSAGREEELYKKLDAGASVINKSPLEREQKAYELQSLLDNAYMDLNPDSAERVIAELEKTNKMDKIRNEAANYRVDLKVSMEERNAVVQEIEDVLTQHFETPYTEDINRLIREINTIRQIGDEQMMQDAMEIFKRLTEDNMSYLLHENEDFAYLNQLYKDYKEITDDIKLNNDLVTYFDDLLGVYRGETDANMLSQRLVEEWKNENYEELFDSMKSDYIDQIFGEERAQTFTANIPIQELDEATARKLFEYFGAKPEYCEVSTKIMDDVNVMSRSQWLAQQNEFVKFYDRMMGLYKMNNTVTSISFHEQNAISNAFQSFMGQGAAYFDPGNNALAYKILKGQSPNEMVTLGGKQYSYRELHNLMQETGVVSETFGRLDVAEEMFAKRSDMGSYMMTKSGEIGSPSSLEPIFQKPSSQMIKDAFAPTDVYKNEMMNKVDGVVQGLSSAFYQPSRNVGQQLEATQRAAFFLNELNHGTDATRAVENLNKYLFDYSDLTDFEKNVMRRVIPFYTYSRKNLPMMLDTLLFNPQRLSPFAKTQNWADNSEDEGGLPNQYRNIWTQQYYQIPGTNMGIDPKLPYSNAFQNNFDWRNKDMASEDYGKLTFTSALNNLVGEINNPISNSAYTLISGSQPRILNEADTDTSMATRGGKVVQGLVGTFLSDAMSMGKNMMDIKDARERMNSAASGYEKNAAESDLKKAQKNLIKSITKDLAVPVDVDMYDYRNWKGNEVTRSYTDDEGNKHEYTYRTNLSEKEEDKIYKDTVIADTKKEYKAYSDYVKGTMFVKKGETKKGVLEKYYYIKDAYKRQKDMGVTKLSYDEWYKKYWD